MSKQTTFCSISNYVEQENPKLMGALRSLCSAGQLKSRGKNGGMTFLMPDAKLSAKIIGAVWKDDVAQVEAGQIVKSLCIPLKIDTLSELGKIQDDVPNKLKQQIAIGSVDVSKGVAKLANGSTISPAKDFKCTSNRSLAVWNLTGTIPLDGKESKGKYTRAEIKGGCHGKPVSVESDLAERGHQLRDGLNSDLLALRVLSYMCWAEKNDPNYLTAGGCFSLLSGCPTVDYFMLFVHAQAKLLPKWKSDTNGLYISANGININEDYRKLYSAQAEKYWAKLNPATAAEAGSSASNPAGQKQLAKAAKLREAVRLDGNRALLRNKIKKIYGDPMKLWADEFRYNAVTEFLATPNMAAPGAFASFCYQLRNVGKPFTSFMQSQLVGSSQRTCLDPSLHMSTSLMFTRSNYMMFMPLTDEMLADASANGAASPPSVIVQSGLSTEIECDESPFNMVKLAFNATASRTAVPLLSKELVERLCVV
jgi:hypothetical protein